MRLKIITIGEPRLSFAKEGFSEYIKRLGAYHKISTVHMRDDVADDKIIAKVDKNFCVVLDESGKQFTSRELAKFLDEKSVQGVSEISFVIGGPNGHSDTIKERADYLLSMSKLTFPHDMAMAILAEALYRASTINAGHPYHRD